MTDFVNPTALCYDSVNDRLLVGENGPDQNIRIYTGLVSGTAPAIPACTGTFGQSVFSGSTPGLAVDPAAGGEARFFAICGVGLDGSGNIYVSTNGNLKAFTPSGSLLWKVQGLDFCNDGDFDHSVDAPDIWTPQHHYAMDYSGNTPGGEWTIKSYLWNDFVWGPEPRAAASCAVYRKINGTPILFTAGQGSAGELRMYRFVGEQIVPCGMLGRTGTVNGVNLWVDYNGNGIMEDNEITVTDFWTHGIYGSFDVATDGSVYSTFGNYSTRPPYIAKLIFGGFNSYGCPLYTVGSAVAVPSNSGFGGGGVYPRVRYAGDTAGGTDTLFVLAATHPLAGGTTGGGTQYNYGATLACYDNWNTSPTLRFSTVLPDPDNNANMTYGQNYANVSAPFYYMGFDVANGMSFISELWGAIHVIDSNGNPVTKILPGPEIDGGCAYEDDCIGTTAHYNPTTRQYYICQENSGYQEKMNFYRWSPVTTLLETTFQDGINPFVLSSTTSGGSMSVVSYNGGNAIQMQDTSVNGENGGTTFTWGLNSAHPLVARINQVLSGTSPVTFTFGFDVKRTIASNKPVFSNILGCLQAFPSDGNPPPNGLGRDFWWTTRASFGTLPEYQSGNLIQIDEATYPKGYDGVSPWRGYCFTVTPDGTGRKINGLNITFSNRADANGTPEAFLINHIFVDEVKHY